jgi:3-methyladenine DNA glycosylase/8-oxoguanine DNA glycosylase
LDARLKIRVRKKLFDFEPKTLALVRGKIGREKKSCTEKSIGTVDNRIMSLTQAQAETSFSLKVIPPFRLDLTVWALRRRPENKMDRWDGKTFRRTLMLNGKPAEVAVTQRGSPEEPRLQASVVGVEFGPDTKSGVTETLNWMLGLQVDLKGFYRSAAKDPRLAILAQRFRGVKPPRFPSLLEALVNGIACQQFTLASGIQLLNRLAEDFGRSVIKTGIRVHAFPRAEELAAVKPELLRSRGLNRQKVRAIIELSRAISEGTLDVEGLASLNDDSAVERLSELHGVGRWTAEYVLLRGLGRVEVFPGDDVGARNTLQQWLGLRKPLDYEGVRRLIAKWNPYAGLVYFHMLLFRLNEAGYLSCHSNVGRKTQATYPRVDEPRHITECT